MIFQLIFWSKNEKRNRKTNIIKPSKHNDFSTNILAKKILKEKQDKLATTATTATGVVLGTNRT
jgi:hypothetical protein